MRLYLAGKRTGLPDYNREAFADATAALRADGHHVISPAELDGAEEGMVAGGDGSVLPEDVYLRGMRKCVVAMLGCEAVTVLDGWEESRGAGVEVDIARTLGLSILSYPTLTPLPIESVLAEAERVVNGARSDAYGHPAEHSARVAGAWQSVFGWDVDAYRVNLAMAIFKVARAATGPHRDSLVDITGYARTAEAVLAREGVPGFRDLGPGT